MPETEAVSTSTEQNASESKRDRSTIEFPYLDLDDAVEIAKGVHTVGGTSCQVEQLAAQLGQAANGGGFRSRIIAAKVYGVVTSERGTVTLTELGMKICDAQQEKSARVDAFLTVPLYRAVYEKFKGSQLPPVSGLEAEMVAMGVAPKQKEKARQVFQRSAKEAGFFDYGAERLVLPSLKGAATPKTDPLPNGGQVSPPDQRKQREANEQEAHHPFIQGLLQKLPKPDSEWDIESRKKWLQTAANIFDLMYTSSDGSSITVTVGDGKKDSAT